MPQYHQWFKESPCDPVQNYIMEGYQTTMDDCPKCSKSMVEHGWLYRHWHAVEGEEIVCPGDFIVRDIAFQVHVIKPSEFNLNEGE